GFSLSNLGSTLVHNAAVHQRSDLTNERKAELGRLERTAFSEHLSDKGVARLKAWVEQAGPRFMAEAQQVIGENEVHHTDLRGPRRRSVGLSIYYFEED